MSPDERGLVSSYLDDMHFNSRPASTQTVTQAISIEVKLINALVIGLPERKVQAQVVSYFTPSCYWLERRVTWTSLGQLIRILKVSNFFMHVFLPAYMSV